MTDASRMWGGPCDGDVAFVDPACWAVAVTRDSDRQGWFHHIFEARDDQPVIIATEAHLYVRAEGDGFLYAPHGLDRCVREGKPNWDLRHIAPGG